MKLGYFAPLPPARSGVADYAAAMLAGLRELGEVRVGEGGDVNLYHVGNNRLHGSIYERAVAEPGIVLLHDAMLQHLLLGMLTEEAYQQEFVYNYGEWKRQLAASLWARRGRMMAASEFFRYPLLRRLAERSRAVIVHTEEARRRVLSHARSAHVAVLPHLQLEPAKLRPSPEDRARFRREQLGCGESDFLCGVFGYLRETKRLPSVLRAVAALREEGLPIRLLVAGEYASDDYARAIEPTLLPLPWVIRRGHVPDQELRLLMQCSDACVNLKYPSAGESSGVAVRAMGLGVPVLVSDAGHGAEFPPETCVRVETGIAEPESLRAALGWLALHPQERRVLAESATAWSSRCAAPARVCRAVWQVARSACVAC